MNLTDEQRQLQALAGQIADERYAAHAVDWDARGQGLPDEERRFLATRGLAGLTLRPDVGGGGAELLDGLLVIEEIAKRSQAAAFPLFESITGAARVVDLHGTDEQRRRWLPPIAAGEATMAVSISEPDAGSAATDMTTAARQSGNSLVINGSKRWCSGAGHAEHYLVYVRMNERRGAGGIGAVVVDREAPGLSFGPLERLMGFHGIASADMHFDDVVVPLDHVIVGPGGFNRLFSTFSIERLGNATMSLAIGQACVDRTARYVQDRRQFGRELIDFQGVQLDLAEMIVAVRAARMLVWDAAASAGHGVPDPLAASAAKYFANQMAKRVSDVAMQLHGGYGFHPDYHVERYHRDAHGWALAGGTPTMQRLRVVSEYLGRRFDQRGQGKMLRAVGDSRLAEAGAAKSDG